MSFLNTTKICDQVPVLETMCLRVDKYTEITDDYSPTCVNAEGRFQFAHSLRTYV